MDLQVLPMPNKKENVDKNSLNFSHVHVCVLLTI